MAKITISNDDLESRNSSETASSGSERIVISSDEFSASPSQPIVITEENLHTATENRTGQTTPNNGTVVILDPETSTNHPARSANRGKSHFLLGALAVCGIVCAAVLLSGYTGQGTKTARKPQPQPKIQTPSDDGGTGENEPNTPEDPIIPDDPDGTEDPDESDTPGEPEDPSKLPPCEPPSTPQPAAPEPAPSEKPTVPEEPKSAETPSEPPSAPEDPQPTPVPPDPPKKTKTVENQVAQDAEQCVVIIHCNWNAQEGASGSGTIISTTGDDFLILTNRHVISTPEKRLAEQIYIRTHDGTTRRAQVAAVPSDEDTDLALLVTPSIDGMKPLWKIGFYDELAQGDKLLAVGHPHGLDFTLTTGICSAKSREQKHLPPIQHTAPTNPGNSGGPLLNTERTLIGVHTSSIPDSQGLFFAFPADLVLDKSLWEYKMDINALLSKIQTTKTKTN